MSAGGISSTETKQSTVSDESNQTPVELDLKLAYTLEKHSKLREVFFRLLFSYFFSPNFRC